MSKALVITGCALVTPLGGNRVATWVALMAGESIRDSGRIAAVEPVPGSARVAQLGTLAAGDAVSDAKWCRERLHETTTALIIGTSKGAIDEWLGTGISDCRLPIAGSSASLSDRTALPASTSDKPSAVGAPWPGGPGHGMRAFGLHSLADDVARHLELGCGPCQTVSAACASGLVALAHAAMLLEYGGVDRAIVVAAESSLHPLVLQSYRRLGVLAGGSQVTRPFDRQRGGFLVSEAAAAVCIERADPRPGDIVLEAWATGADASHLTGMDPAAPAMRHCLRQAARGPVDVVHAHATGTELNDPIELAALESALPRAAERTIVYSHKGALGHSMGASGLISAALNVIMHRTGRVPPNVNTTEPIAARRCLISPEAIERPIRRSMVISAGFGGPVAVVALRTR